MINSWPNSAQTRRVCNPSWKRVWSLSCETPSSWCPRVCQGKSKTYKYGLGCTVKPRQFPSDTSWTATKICLCLFLILLLNNSLTNQNLRHYIHNLQAHLHNWLRRHHHRLILIGDAITVSNGWFSSTLMESFSRAKRFYVLLLQYIHATIQ